MRLLLAASLLAACGSEANQTLTARVDPGGIQQTFVQAVQELCPNSPLLVRSLEKTMDIQRPVLDEERQQWWHSWVLEGVEYRILLDIRDQELTLAPKLCPPR